MRIMAVDDESKALRVLKEAIKEAEPEAEVLACASVEIALRNAGLYVPDVAFLDIRINEGNGIELAKELKQMNPKINVVFVTAYSEYAIDAVELHSSGYIMKPVTAEDVRRELDNLLYPVERPHKRIYAHTFGNFELLVDDVPIRIRLAKSREMLAYLIDRDGAGVNRKELAGILFEDRKYTRKEQNYLSKIYKDLKDALEAVGAGAVLCKGYNQYYVDKTQFDSDLRDYREGKPDAINAFNGEYMSQYSWAEESAADLYIRGRMYKL